MARTATSATRLWPALAVAGLAALAAVVLPRVGLASVRYLTEVLPMADAVTAAYRAGELPQWWPALDLGTSLAALPESGALYPFKWLLLFGGGSLAHDLFVMAHGLLAAWGLARWTRALGGDRALQGLAAAMALVSGPLLSAAVGPTPIAALAWLPVVGWRSMSWANAVAAVGEGGGDDAAPERALAGVLAVGERGLLLAMPILAGSLTLGVCACLLAVALTVGRGRAARRRGVLLACGALFAAALSAPAWLPWLLTPAAHPGAPATLWQWLGSLAPLGFSSFDRPGWELGRALAGEGAFVERTRSASLFLGGGVWVLAVLGVIRGGGPGRRLGALSALLLIASVTVGGRLSGDAFALVAALLLVVVAVVGLQRCAGEARRRPWYLLAVPALAAAATLLSWRAGVALADRAARAAIRPSLVDPDAAVERALVAGWSAVGVSLIVALIAIRWAGPGRRRHPRAVALLGGVVVIASLLHGAPGVLRFAPRAAIEAAPPLLADPSLAPGRLFRGELELDGSELAVRAALPYVGTRFGWSYARGRRSFDERFESVWRASATLGGRALDAFAIDYAVVPNSVVLATGRPVAARDDEAGVVLIANPNARPRAFVTPRFAVASWAETVAALFPPAFDESTPFDLGAVRLGVSAAGWRPNRANDRAGDRASAPPRVPIRPCVVREPSPGRVTVACSSERGGVLVLLDRLAPGWSAMVNGRRAPIATADLLGRAVPVEAGEVLVEFRFRAPGMRAGAAACASALLGWALLLAYLVVRRRRRRVAAATSG